MCESRNDYIVLILKCFIEYNNYLQNITFILNAYLNKTVMKYTYVRDIVPKLFLFSLQIHSVLLNTLFSQCLINTK